MSVEPRFAYATAFEDIDRVYEKQQARRPLIAATTASDRIRKLRRLHDALFARRDEIRAALWADYQKPAAEVDLSELMPVVGEARHAMANLRSWMEPQHVPTPLMLL